MLASPRLRTARTAPTSDTINVRRAFVSTQPQYITIGDDYTDAYSGQRKLPQASTEAKDPFANGMEAASRHRGRQFAAAHPKTGQGQREVGVGVKFVSTNVGDVYEDVWKRQNKHYQRAARKDSKAEGPGMRTGHAPPGLVHPQPAHLPTFGHTVAIPTRNHETHTSYVPPNKSKSAAATTSRTSPVRRRRVKKDPKPVIVDDYAAQERLRRQMVMGLGAGCRGPKVKEKKVAARPGTSPRWKPSTLRKSGPSALFDAHANAELIEGTEPLPSASALARSKTCSPVSARLPKAERPLPFKPGGSQAASRYCAIDAIAPRAGAAQPDAATAGIAPSPHMAGRERVAGDRVRLRNRQARDGAFVPTHPSRRSATEAVRTAPTTGVFSHDPPLPTCCNCTLKLTMIGVCVCLCVCACVCVFWSLAGCREGAAVRVQ